MASPVADYLASVLDRHRGDRAGAPWRAPGAPEDLPEPDPDAFGICLATVDGYLYEVGDTRTDFAIQSISKPFTYGLAIADRGFDAVDAKLDVEPSGDAYNEISLDPVSGRPANAMVNAGALAAASLVAGGGVEERFERIRAEYSRWAGRELRLDGRMLAAELPGAHRHRAIAHLLRGSGIVEEEPDDPVEIYFRQCAVQVDCRDLALMAATLANGGTNPRSGEEVREAAISERVLSVMTTCGMYDSAGEWVAAVGMPAKSGVGGGVLAVLPGQIGIAVFSPRLDAHGNSVRGFAACRQISDDLELHFLHVTRARRSAVRASWDVLARPSSRRRTPAEQEVLQDHGGRARVYELHGDVLFAGAEAVVRQLSEQAEQLDAIVLDVGRVAELGDVARRLLLEGRDRLDEEACKVAVVDPDGMFPRVAESGSPAFADIDDALAWAEDLLIERHGEGTPTPPDRIAVEHHPLLDALEPDQRAVLSALLRRRHADPGERLVSAGDDPAGIFLVLSGQLSATVPDGDDGTRQVALLGPATSFGKRSLIAGEAHATNVEADSPTELLVLGPAALAQLERTAPHVALALVRTMFAQAHATVERGSLDPEVEAEAVPGGTRHLP
ncbi:MAG: glutaminase A [Solirubrobacterales bacterium]|nr:glutaminase A [Solirubrobacterales bacterium]